MGGDFFIKTASYGHFGREDINLPWENVEDISEELEKINKRFSLADKYA